MSGLIRFGVSLEKELLHKFDQRLKEKGYTNRSEGLRDLIRQDLVVKEWQTGAEVTAAITLVYDHHQRSLLNRLMDIQHDFHGTILSAQHIHLDHHNCLEIVVTKGSPRDIELLHGKLKSCKGVKHSGFAMATTGRGMK